jgi:hypothetical protein
MQELLQQSLSNVQDAPLARQVGVAVGVVAGVAASMPAKSKSGPPRLASMRRLLARVAVASLRTARGKDW